MASSLAFVAGVDVKIRAGWFTTGFGSGAALTAGFYSSGGSGMYPIGVGGELDTFTAAPTVVVSLVTNVGGHAGLVGAPTTNAQGWEQKWSYEIPVDCTVYGVRWVAVGV